MILWRRRRRPTTAKLALRACMQRHAFKIKTSLARFRHHHYLVKIKLIKYIFSPAPLLCSYVVRVLRLRENNARQQLCYIHFELTGWLAGWYVSSQVRVASMHGKLTYRVRKANELMKRFSF